jgi:SNF2 family DNA or RNA helicase
MKVGSIPFPLNTILAPQMGKISQFGTVGGYKSYPQTTIPNIFIEAVLKVENKPIAPTNLGVTLFAQEINLGSIFQLFMQSNIFPHKPDNYQPSDHLGIQLANLSNLLTSLPQPENLSNTNFDQQLLTIPSGCDLLPVYPPREIIKSTLLPHQAQGLAFMLDQESLTSISSQSLWEKTTTPAWYLWQSKISGTQIGFSNAEDLPETALGSILADDMGLGKSLQAISLIACTLHESINFSIKNPTIHPQPTTASHATLLIFPERLVNNWSDEIIKHVSHGSIQFVKYHGRQRHLIPQTSFNSSSIIITS